jgi:glucose-6-phosphate dehydrogenase assembly protein OpcA
VLLRLHGELAKVPESVVTPLLLPDSPVIVWWPGGGPKVPASDPLGKLGRRRVTDAAATRRASVDFSARAEGYQPGDTDFAWSRLTPWRALMAAALDQYPAHVTGAEVVSAKGNPSADLMAAWLQCKLGVAVEQKTSRGPGLTAVRLFTPAGPIVLSRPDGSIATFSVPGQPDRPVALKRRTPSELLSEELRRLDPDDVYAQTLACMVERESMPAEAKKVSATDRRSAQSAAEKAAVRTAVVEGKAASPELEAHAADAKKKAPAKKASAAAKKTSAAKSATKKTTAPAAKKTAKKATGKKVAGRS